MQKKQRHFHWIVILMSLSLLGLVGLQAVLLNNARKLEKQTFDQSVRHAMASIVRKVEALETYSKIVAMSFNDSTGVREEFEHIVVANFDSTKKAPPFPPSFRRIRASASAGSSSFYRYTTDSDRNVEITSANDAVNFVTTTRLPRDSVRTIWQFKSGENDSTKIHIEHNFFTPFQVNIAPEKRRKVIVNRVLDELKEAPLSDIRKRIEPAKLDSIVHQTIGELGLETDFVYGIYANQNDTLLLTSDSLPQSMKTALKTSAFSTPLFAYDIRNRDNLLQLYFPEQNIYILKKMGWMISSSLVLLGFVFVGFIYTTRTVFSLRRFAQSVSDFINNMTHEFKTPISSIGLAAEALKNQPNLREDAVKFERYRGIIQDENQRMRSQVEKILHMATLEKGDYELKTAPLDIHKTIEDVVKNLALQIEKANGKLTTDFCAGNTEILADKLHFSGIIFNLLDNAIKYTRETPEIHIATRNVAHGVEIVVQDNGIGLKPEDQKRIFDKYFRVSTGNVHDVKGFGLGLSYVKLMLEAHGGDLFVQSEFGRGSTFTLFFPFNAGAEHGA